MTRFSLPTRVIVLVALLASLTVRMGADPVAAAPEAASARSQGSEVGHRKSSLDLALVSRTYDAGNNNWKIVAEARLTSNRICLPIAFNCIVGEVASPSNATLADLTCKSPLWTHLLVFRDHCLKEIFWAGHQQKFQFTWTTDPGVATGTVEMKVEFGRGFLPVVFQQLAEASLTVDLGTPSLDISKTCPATVDSGATLTCQVNVAYPATQGGGPDIEGITVTDQPDSALAALTSSPDLTFVSGDGTWDCSGTLACTAPTLSQGQSATFDYAATVVNTATGGSGVNDSEVKWSDPSPGGSKAASHDVVVVGTGDTTLEIEKSTTQTQVAPGGQVSWTVEVTNAGPVAATNVTLTDIAPDGVQDAVITYSSGVGTWSCQQLTCTTDSMPVGSATFGVTATVPAGAAPDSAIVNEVEVRWDNDVLGPDFPITAGSAVPVVGGATTTTTPGPTTTTTPRSGSPGATLSVVA